MKYLLTCTLVVSLGFRGLGDVKFVDFHKVDPTGLYAAQKEFLLDNLVYYDHWSPNWGYEVSKDSLIQGLKSCLSLFGPLRNNEHEVDLLLGEIGHYLYNLDQESYYDTAEAYYRKAITTDPTDLRGYWFMGYAYSQSAEIPKGVSELDTALSLANQDTPADFWQEYAFTMITAGMPSHSRYALDKFLLKGGGTDLGHRMDSTLRKTMIPADVDSTYEVRELWNSLGSGSHPTFLSRPLGMRITLDSDWNVEMHPLRNRTSAVVIKPDIATSPSGKQIGYTIGIIIQVAGKGQTLQDFVAKFLQPGEHPDTTWALTKQYPVSVCLRIKDNSVYQDRGGGRFTMLGIERDCPRYPGLALEDRPEPLPGTPGQMSYFIPGLIRTRATQKLYYLVLLDTCGDIEDTSLKTFRDLVEKRLLIE